MKRYSTTRQKFDKSGVRVYSTTYYPEIPISNNDVFIVSREGDRLDNLAHKYYSDNKYYSDFRSPYKYTNVQMNVTGMVMHVLMMFLIMEKF